MSTPPNPPSTPSGPPTEPAGAPVPEAASIPAPAQPLSLDKPAAPAPDKPEPLSLDKPQAPSFDKPPALTPPQPLTPAPALTEDPAQPADAAPAAPAPGAFAPVAPGPAAPAAPPAHTWGAPYGAPGAPAPGAPTPGNPWATPAAGHPGGYPGGPQASGFPAPPPATNGLALAALLLGLFGIFVGLVPFFFWAGALLAVTGAGIGIAAVLKSRRGAPRATMAAIGTVLGILGIGASVGGWFITTAVIDKIDRNIADSRSGDYEYDEDYGYGSETPSAPASPTPKPSPSDIPGRTSALAWGKPYTYEDGVQVTVQSAVPYKPSSTAYPAEARNGNAVKVTVKIVNNSGAALDVSLALPHARDDQGTEAEMAFDSSVPKMFKGSVMAGESMTGTFAFLVPEGTKSLHFEIAPDVEREDAIWNGPIG
ncbi:DUF4352 domain-containing protein [Streptomyces sp. NPDC058401]|uniref:DUF4352 domain-containing protein n=1 Tax=Streptomyces sp. NPDC058401 TaxID=3346480 RepID=UPI00365FECD0